MLKTVLTKNPRMGPGYKLPNANVTHFPEMTKKILLDTKSTNQTKLNTLRNHLTNVEDRQNRARAFKYYIRNLQMSEDPVTNQGLDTLFSDSVDFFKKIVLEKYPQQPLSIKNGSEEFHALVRDLFYNDNIVIRGKSQRGQWLLRNQMQKSKIGIVSP